MVHSSVLRSISCIVFTGFLAACSSNVPSITTSKPTPPKTQTVDIKTQKSRKEAARFVAKEPEYFARATARNNIKVALLLPFTGESEALAQAMLQASQMALFDMQLSYVELRTYDTEGKAAGAEDAAEQALADGADIILGPIFSHTTTAAATTIDGRIPVVSFSNNQLLSDKGVYLLGFMSTDQTKRMAKYALSRGVKEFYVVVPSNHYGKLTAATFREEVVKGGGAIVRTEFYTGHTVSLKRAAESIGNAMNGASSSVIPESTRKAVYIPEGGDTLLTLASILRKKDITEEGVLFLGSGQWDEQYTLMQPVLSGGWFVSSSPKLYRTFTTRFSSLYDYTPPRLATLAYDAVALAGTLSHLYPGQPFVHDNLILSHGFKGIDGVFRLTEDGVAERGLAVLEITDEGAIVRDQAPDSFAMEEDVAEEDTAPTAEQTDELSY